MTIRRIRLELRLVLAAFALAGCSQATVETSGCQNLLGNTCKPTEPSGNFAVEPNPVVEGKNVVFNLDIADPNPDEAVTCQLDPDGDGVFQLNVACSGPTNYVFQSTGTVVAKVKVRDSQNQETILSRAVTVSQAVGGLPVTQFKLVDLVGEPVSGAKICVVQPGEFECDSDIRVDDGPLGTYTVTPALPQDSPTPKEFRLLVVVPTTDPDKGRTIAKIRVDNDNLAEVVTVLAPLNCDAVACVDKAGEADPGVFGVLSGVVAAENGTRIAGAQVSISGGVATGGPYRTVFTDANGQFDLLINVNGSLRETVAKSSMLVFADGFASALSQIEVTSRNYMGVNFELEPLPPLAEVPLFRETFEPDSVTATQWTVAGSELYDDADAAVKWQLLSAENQIVNNAVSGCVLLAPGDISAARVLPPVQGTLAFWYGKKPDGNFLGTPSEGGCEGLSGGTSDSANSGTLTSPFINLSGVKGPVRLTMKTFWEIESVNPNSGGFDLMIVKMSTDGGKTFAEMSRLNPLSDPVFEGNRSPIPFSNTGFNAPPLWLQQESIALPNAAGKTIQLRFEFDTKDGLFNGFRGWMIDDVRVEKGQGRLASGSTSS